MEAYETRIGQLLQQGESLLARMPLEGGSFQRAAPAAVEPQYRAWLASSANVIGALALPDSTYLRECARIMDDSDLRYRVPTRVAQQMFGLLQALKSDLDAGVLRQIEYVVAAATFDDFLDHASGYHKGNRKIEASVLASAVLEDTLKRVARKHGVNASGQSIEQIIDALVKALVFTEVRAKRVRAYAGVRNHADHAEWEKFDIKDVGDQIAGIRELIDEYL